MASRHSREFQGGMEIDLVCSDFGRDSTRRAKREVGRCKLRTLLARHKSGCRGSRRRSWTVAVSTRPSRANSGCCNPDSRRRITIGVMQYTGSVACVEVSTTFESCCSREYTRFDMRALGPCLDLPGHQVSET